VVVARRNLEDLRNPVHVTDFFSTETVSDHNQYVLGDHVYQSNYMAGLRILHADQSDAVPHLTETGFFDGESTLTTPSSIQRTGFGFALCPLQKFVLGSAVQAVPTSSSAHAS